MQNQRTRRTEEQLCFQKAILVAFLVLCSTLAVLLLTARSAQAKRQEKASYKYYTSITVEQGDTLWSIAEEQLADPETASFYTNMHSYIEEVQTINGLQDLHWIKAGRNLIVPYYASEYIQ